MNLLLAFLVTFAVIGGMLLVMFFGLVFFVALHQRMRWLSTGEAPVDPVDEMISDLLHHIFVHQRAARIVARERRYS